MLYLTAESGTIKRTQSFVLDLAHLSGSLEHSESSCTESESLKALSHPSTQTIDNSMQIYISIKAMNV